MQTIEPVLRERGVEVLAVTFTPAKVIAMFLSDNALPFPIVSDPNRDAYRIFELGRTSIFSFFRPSVLWKFLRQMASGWKILKPRDRDVLQLGGDVLMDRDGRVAWSWISRHPQDRPTAEAIRAAVERLDR